MRKRTYLILGATALFVSYVGYVGVTTYLNAYHKRGNNSNITMYEGQDLRDDTPTIIQELIDKDPERIRTNKEYEERMALKKRSSQIKVKKVKEINLEEEVQKGD